MDFQATLTALDAENVPRRIRTRDHTVWRDRPDGISDRLGWLDVVDWMRPRLPEIRAFGDELAAEGVRDVVLLGMGGSSLAAEVFARTFGSAPGRPRLHVLDTTSPARIRRVSEAIEPGRFHALVSSKSGSTIEVLAALAHFQELAKGAGPPGARFTAITDPGTSLERHAQDEGFRGCFCNDPAIGGRYSALSYFGLVPAAVLGLDVDELLQSAGEMTEECLADRPAAENPGAVLGAAMGSAAAAGRDKLTILLSEEIRSFGLWVEQLVAESTGKDGVGIVPVLDDSGAERAQGGDDRLFLSVRLESSREPDLDRREDLVRASGVPLIRIDVKNPMSIGAEMYRWEYATAIAGHVLGIHPFDQPDVQATKSATSRALKTLESDGRLPEIAPGDPVALLQRASAGDYVAILAFGDPDDDLLAAVAEAREAIGQAKGLATTFGVGPRFLHSTGQLHKGGANQGIFLQLVLDEAPLPIPGRPFGFAELLAAQAAGDLEALRTAGRRAARLDGRNPAGALRSLAAAVRSA